MLFKRKGYLSTNVIKHYQKKGVVPNFELNKPTNFFYKRELLLEKLNENFSKSFAQRFSYYLKNLRFSSKSGDTKTINKILDFLELDLSCQPFSEIEQRKRGSLAEILRKIILDGFCPQTSKRAIDILDILDLEKDLLKLVNQIKINKELYDYLLNILQKRGVEIVYEKAKKSKQQ
ncbi:MAG: hypothetical protein N3D10_03440 [Candidatus Micrarchaeota archaeon]|nr:hypothetical protein [Candidatus Micrarchaeota archaeon]